MKHIPTLKDLLKAQMHDRIQAARKQFQPHELRDTGIIIRQKSSRFSPSDFAIMQKHERQFTASHLIKRFYNINEGTTPQAHTFYKRAFYDPSPSWHAFVYYASYFITVERSLTDDHFARLYYVDQDKHNHHIATTTVKSSIFQLVPSLQKELTTAIDNRKFKIAIHQLETLIPL